MVLALETLENDKSRARSETVGTLTAGAAQNTAAPSANSASEGFDISRWW